MSDDNTKTGEQTASDEGKAPEFDGEFDAERAKRAIANLRTEVETLKGERDSARTAFEEFKAAAEKTGDERETALKDALARAATAERDLVIKKHNLPDDVVAEFADYLTGTAEEVEAKASKLAARLAPPKGEEKPGDGEPGDKEEPPAPPVVERPKAALTPGHGAEQSKPFDAKAIAEKARG